MTFEVLVKSWTNQKSPQISLSMKQLKILALDEQKSGMNMSSLLKPRIHNPELKFLNFHGSWKDNFPWRYLSFNTCILNTQTVADKRAGECVDPEGNGVNLGEGDGGGASPPSEEQDKQLISNSGGNNTPMGQAGRQEDESDVTTRTHHAQSK